MNYEIIFTHAGSLPPNPTRARARLDACIEYLEGMKARILVGDLDDFSVTTYCLTVKYVMRDMVELVANLRACKAVVEPEIDETIKELEAFYNRTETF